MIVIGIDPGKSGGIAAVNDRGKLILASPMPLAGKEIAPHKISNLLTGICEDEGLENTAVYIEHCQAMPKQGVVSMFNYGVGFGMLQGICAALDIVYVLVKPRDWQKMMHRGADQSADPKDRSAQVVNRLFPGDSFKASERCKKDHDGMIDAALIASYGLRMILGQSAQDSSEL